MLKISLLGKMRMEYNGTHIENQLGTKTIALIGLLLMSREKCLSRDKIIAYLWPDSSEEAARYNLRYNLWLIKKTIEADCTGESFILSEKDCCSINDKYSFECDILTLKECKPERETDPQKLLLLKELFRGDFLEGWYLKSCNEFNDMILFERMACENKQVEILKRLAAIYGEQERHEENLLILKEMTSIEPENEEFALRIMQNYVITGNRAAAINHYKAFETSLWSSLSITPAEELKQYYNRILANPLLEKKIVHSQKKKVKLMTHCMKNVEYFWVSDVIAELTAVVEPAYLFQLDRGYIRDLCSVQRELFLLSQRYLGEEEERLEEIDIPPVRTIHAFYKLLLHVLAEYDLHVCIKNADRMDEASAEILEYIKDMNETGLCFEC